MKKVLFKVMKSIIMLIGVYELVFNLIWAMSKLFKWKWFNKILKLLAVDARDLYV